MCTLLWQHTDHTHISITCHLWHQLFIRNFDFISIVAALVIYIYSKSKHIHNTYIDTCSKREIEPKWTRWRASFLQSYFLSFWNYVPVINLTLEIYTGANRILANDPFCVSKFSVAYYNNLPKVIPAPSWNPPILCTSLHSRLLKWLRMEIHTHTHSTCTQNLSSKQQ